MGEPRSRDGVPAALGAMISVQIGAAVASDLFEQLSPPAVLLVRQGLAAAVLLAWVRPRWQGLSRDQWRVALGFGAVMSAMSLCMYEAIDRIPLGLAVSIELCGPIAIAIAMSRRRSDLMWAVLAAVGLLVLRAGSFDIGETPGMLFAAAAAVGWAGYLMMAQRVGDRFEGQNGLALGMVIAALCTAPFAAVSDVTPLVDPGIAARAALVALLSALVPFTLDLRAIRALGARLVSLLLALSPVVASVVGLIFLRERPSSLEVVGVMIIVGTAVGAFQASVPRASAHRVLREPVASHDRRLAITLSRRR